MFFSETITSTSTSTSWLVSSIAEEKEERSVHTETWSETDREGEDTTAVTSVNVSERQRENTVSTFPRYNLQIKT
jgi:hypothetical protein